MRGCPGSSPRVTRYAHRHRVVSVRADGVRRLENPEAYKDVPRRTPRPRRAYPAVAPIGISTREGPAGSYRLVLHLPLNRGPISRAITPPERAGYTALLSGGRPETG